MLTGWEIITQSLPLFTRGLLMTLALWLCAGVLSIALGSTLGVISALSRFRFITTAIRSYVFFVRGVPLYVQILLFYFTLPQLLGVNLPAFLAAILALGICSSAYVTEIIRAGIKAVSLQQWEAAYVLGYSTWQTIRFIILPQVLRIAAPSLANESDSLLKSTALLASIGLLELTRVANNIVSRHMNPEIIYPCVALFYLMPSASIMLFSRYIERRFSYVVRS